MNPPKNIVKLLSHLWSHISSRRRIQFGLILVMIVFAAFAEIISIGAVVPFLGVLTAPDLVFNHPTAQPFIKILGISRAEDLLLPLTLLFGCAAIFAGGMRLFLLWAITRLSYATGADLSLSIYQRTLYQPYEIHVGRNSSEVISGIVTKANSAISSVIMPSLTIISSSFLMTMIMIALIAIDPFIALISFASFGSMYLLIIFVSRRQLLKDSQRVAKESIQVVKSLQEGLGGIRDVLIDNSQDVYCDIYRKSDLALRRAQGNNTFIGQSPRFLMEAAGMLMIAALAFTLGQQSDGLAKAIPLLGALALGAQRLLPILQQAYSGLTLLRGGQASLVDTLELLDQDLPDFITQKISKPLAFTKKITLNQVSFRYGLKMPWVLESCTLDIDKGSRIGFIGETGCGKSTLLDIIMGLLQPTSGNIDVDGESITFKNSRAWQMHIAHVPQDIFLADSSIAENIAFGMHKSQIDLERVRVAARGAQIENLIDSWTEGYDTVVGERGVRLSGGQRQRIGIARALYKQTDVIIFDEATSALDAETEQAVMSSIESLSKDLTVLIIAHRVTTLKNCSKIVQLSDGQVSRICSYQEMVDNINPA
ncbi:ABC transporter ATP-binding protein/permease [Gammaproteobacteria bacterium]|nr:ABC transporter ATP-binding protein/permease [Gammaproteobacteria bacterium]